MLGILGCGCCRCFLGGLLGGFFLLAFGMIVRWRLGMYRQYRRLVP